VLLPPCRPALRCHVGNAAGAGWKRPFLPRRIGWGYGFFRCAALGPCRSSIMLRARVDTASRRRGFQGDVDLLGIHTGFPSRRFEVAHQLGSHATTSRPVVGMPLFSTEEQQRQLGKVQRTALRPAGRGRPMWLGALARPAFRLFASRRYDLADVASADSWSMCSRRTPVRRFARLAVTPSREKQLKSSESALDGLRPAPMTLSSKTLAGLKLCSKPGRYFRPICRSWIQDPFHVGTRPKW